MQLPKNTFIMNTLESLLSALQAELRRTTRDTQRPGSPEKDVELLATKSMWAAVNAQTGGLLDDALEYSDQADFLTHSHPSAPRAHVAAAVPAPLYTLPSHGGCGVVERQAAVSGNHAFSPAVEDSKLILVGSDTTLVVSRGKPAVRKWTDAKRERHKLACKDKSKLSLGDKLEIIRLHKHGQTQAQLAEQYDKSRSAISKILRPQNIARLKSVAETGVEPEMRSYSLIIKNLDLEKAVHEMVSRTRELGESRASIKAQVIKNFKVSRGWCARFLKRHNFA